MLTQQSYAGHFLSGLSFFHGLPQADMEALLGAARIRSYAKDEALFHCGDSAKSVYVILSGWVKLCRYTEEGDETILAVLSRGDVVGEGAICRDVLYPHTSAAAGEVHAIELYAETLRQVAFRNPEIISRVTALMSREITDLQINQEHMSLMSAPERLGCLLLRLSASVEGTGGSFEMPYDKSLAAAQLSMSPETFSRGLAELRKAQVATEGAQVHIGSFCALANICCRNCSVLPGERRCASRRSQKEPISLTKEAIASGDLASAASLLSGKETPCQVIMR